MLACFARNLNFEAIRDILKRIASLTLTMTRSGGNIAFLLKSGNDCVPRQ